MTKLYIEMVIDTHVPKEELEGKDVVISIGVHDIVAKAHDVHIE